MTENRLPVGTVVRLNFEDFTRDYMIIAYHPVVTEGYLWDKRETITDYFGVLVPQGYQDVRATICFDQSDIQEVIRMGVDIEK